MSKENKIVVFQEKEIRKALHKEEWWYAVVDVVAILTESSKPRDYWYRLKKREKESSGVELSTNCRQLKLESSDGKKYNTECANTEGMFRIIQSIPSPKAEPFKQWLATVGYERIQEIENPELAAERARQYYRALGYNDDWIAKRLQSIEVRGQLTDEWKERGVKEGLEYAILTAEISQATFGMKPSDYKEFKNLKRENLRDHMTNLEFIFTMLGEESTKKQAQSDDAKGFEENQKAALKAGKAAGDALDAFEKTSGQKVVTPDNFLKQIEEAKKGIKGQEKLKLDEPK